MPGTVRWCPDVGTAVSPVSRTTCHPDRVSSPPDLPPIVTAALDRARRLGFVSSARLETGRLLAAVAAGREGVLAETGTGAGVGAAWIASALRPGAHLLTIDRDASLTESATVLFAGDDRVTVLGGDWTQLAAHGPFSLLFVDGGAKQDGPDAVADLVGAGGTVVLDDFTPSDSWPPVYRGRVDSLREAWLTDGRFVSAEVAVTSDAAVLLATRRG